MTQVKPCKPFGIGVIPALFVPEDVRRIALAANWAFAVWDFNPWSAQPGRISVKKASWWDEVGRARSSSTTLATAGLLGPSRQIVK